jgi:acyl-CoA hydrolase
MDRLAAVVANRHAGCTCVTVSVDAVHFLAPAERGDTLVFCASVNRAWRSSMEIGVRVEAETLGLSSKKHIVSAYFTFVAVDADKKPTAVLPVLPENPQQKARHEEAELRRNSRLDHAEKLKKLRAATPSPAA